MRREGYFLLYHMLSQALFQTPILSRISLSRSFAYPLSHTKHSSSISALPVHMSASMEGMYRV